MIPYNPSSFDRNKTILEQILELKNWLKEHPSYKVYQCFAHYMPNQFTSYAFSQLAGDIQTIEAMAVGDVVFFADSYYAVVTAVDLDNEDFDIQSAVSFKGPQGPQGEQGPAGADGTNGTNGTDGKYISNVSVDGNGDLICTIYDPETSTSTQVNAGHVVGPAGQDGQGMQVINTTTTTGTLSASDLAKANGTDDCILIYTDSGVDLTMQRIFKDSSYVYFYAHFLDSGKAQCLVCDVDAVTGAYNIDGGNLPIKASNINSETATNGQVLTADGNGGASWQNASGSFTHYVIITSETSGTITLSDIPKLEYNDSVLIYQSGTNTTFYNKDYETSGNIYFTEVTSSAGVKEIKVVKSTGAYEKTSSVKGFRSSAIDSQTATNGQVLTANGSGGASWQNAGGGSTLYEHNIMCQENNFNWTLRTKIISNSSTTITTKDALLTILNTNGFTNVNNYNIATGNYKYGGTYYLVVGIFSNGASNLTITRLDNSFVINSTNIYSDNFSVSDIVVTL